MMTCAKLAPPSPLPKVPAHERLAERESGWHLAVRCLRPRKSHRVQHLSNVQERPRAMTADRDADHCRRCSLCEGMDHHWMAHCDDGTPDPIMVCKHCPATREMTDDDE
jgi:hypothetical protein